MGGSHGSGAPTGGPRQTLVSLLEMAFGSATSAHDAIAAALVLAGKQELPEGATDLIAFVRAHLLPTLSEQIGPRLTMALVDDLVEKLDALRSSSTEDSGPPSSMPRPIARISPRSVGSPDSSRGSLSVVLVDGDRLGRTSIARSLLRARWDVTVVDELSELQAMLDTGEAIHVVVIDTAHPAAQPVIELLRKDRPEAVVVARSNDAIRSRAHLAHLGVKHFDVRPREASAEELVDAIKRARGA